MASSENGGAAAARAAALERMAVQLSFWVGGAGLAALKGVAYIATGSALVRTSMFDSLGDVISSAIMFVTQRKVNDSRDAHRYPVGKGRLPALGVLFFCAFMCSAMSSMVIDSLQTLLSSEEQQEDHSGVVDASLRRLFAERPRLRWAYGPWRVEGLIAEHAGHHVVGEAQGPSVDTLSTALLLICFAVKVLLLVICGSIQRLRGSEIVRALAADHRNDSITNGITTGTMALFAAAEGQSWAGPWLAKLDPAVSLVLSSWITYGWVSSAMEQIRALSDQRADGADVGAITEAARQALKGAPLELRGADVYNVGEGYRVLLQLCPLAGSGDAERERIAEVLEALEVAVRGASGEVQAVEAVLRPRASQQGVDGSSASWVREYPPKTAGP